MAHLEDGKTFWDQGTFNLKHSAIHSSTLKRRTNYPRTLCSQFDFVHRWEKFPGKCDTLCSKCEFVLTPFALGLITYLFIQMQCIDFRPTNYIIGVVLNGLNLWNSDSILWSHVVMANEISLRKPLIASTSALSKKLLNVLTTYISLMRKFFYGKRAEVESINLE